MRLKVYLLVKYALSSLSATVVDFGLFYVFFSLTAHAGSSTFVGWTVSAVLAFFLHKRWVFGLHDVTRVPALGTRYGAGVVLGLGLNVSGVWLLSDEIGWSPWFSRVSVALLVWYLVFLFNRHIVFVRSNE